MDSQAILPNIFGPTFDENQWKSFYFNNCLYFSQNQNMDFFNSFGLCNDMLTGQNLFSPYFQTDLIMRNMLFNIPPMDDTMIRMIQNINDSLAQLSNNYHDLINQNPPVLNQILNVNHRNEIIQNSLQSDIREFHLLTPLNTTNNNRALSREEINIIPTMRFGVTTEKKKNKLDAKSKKIKKENQEKNEPTSNQTCNICLEDYKHREILRILKCNHRFHKKCIDSWLSKKNRCPLCKTII